MKDNISKTNVIYIMLYEECDIYFKQTNKKETKNKMLHISN